MPRPDHPLLACLALAAALWGAAPATAADLPGGPPLAGDGVPAYAGIPAYAAGGGFRVARIPLRPAPIRYDIYGYPLLAGRPSPLEAGACPPALQPTFDPDGNLAGYAPLAMCR